MGGRSVIVGISLYIIGLLLAASSFAATGFAGGPRVGDTASFSGTMSNADRSIPIQLVQKVTAAHADGTFMVETYISVQGRNQTQLTSRKPAEIGNDDMARAAIAKCAQNGGVIEPVTIGTGEVIESCKFTSLRGQQPTIVHIAPVPFMNTRFQQTANGITTALLMQSYTRGQE
jgi:putative hemolysin